MQLHQFLSQLFSATPNYSLSLALAKLRAFGGISSLLNSLAIDHRQIMNIYESKGEQRMSSKTVKEEDRYNNIVLKSHVQLENVLLYLVTLSFFTKFLLFHHQMRQELNVYSEITSFIMLIFITVQKKSRRKLQNIEIMQDHLITNQKKFKIRRNGYEKLLDQQEIEQGDIVLLEKGDVAKFDGIILGIAQNIEQQSSSKLEEPTPFIVVNEEQVGTGRSKCNKNTVWDIEQKCLKDPFLLVNTKILSGSVWVLVCLGVKSNPSKRNDNELGSALKLSKLSYQVQQIIMLAVILLVVYLSSVWMVGSSMNGYDVFLQMVYLISSLILYLSYANTGELLEGLKRYLKQKTTGKGYRIVNPKLLQKFSEVDLILIEDNCLSKDLSLTTKINKSIDLKIITTSFVGNIFRFGNINDELIFNLEQDKKLKCSLDELIKSKFISLQYEQFRGEFLSIFRDMKYSIVYVSRSRQAMDKFQDIITIKCSEMNIASAQRVQTQWMRISQGMCTQQILLDLIEKARVYKRFQQSFYTVIINNCLQLSMLIGWALAGCLVDLNLNLLIIFSNRNRVRQFYEALYDGSHEQNYKAKGIVHSIEVNFIFLLYYIYMNWEIQQSNNRQFMLFLILMANRMFRIEALLREKNIQALFKRMLTKSLGILGLIILEAFIKWELGYRSDFVSQSLDILLLPLILFLFVLFL